MNNFGNLAIGERFTYHNRDYLKVSCLHARLVRLGQLQYFWEYKEFNLAAEVNKQDN